MMSLAHALAGLVLIASFAMLGQQRLRPMFWLCAVQALLTALVVLLQRDLRLAWFALVAFALNGLLMPLLLARQAGDERIARAGVASWVGGLVLAAVSVATAMQAADGGRMELLAAALTVCLLGLLQSARSPTTGVLSAQYGVILLVAAVPHVASLALVVVAMPIMPVTIAVASRPGGFCSSSRLAVAVTAFLMIGVAVLALLSDEPALTWLVAVLAAALHARSNPASLAPLAAAMLVALAGTLLLHLAAGNAAIAWSGAAITSNRTLNLAGVFLLLGYGALAVQVASSPLVAVPLLIMLRVRQIGVAPELLLAFGLAGLLVAASLRRPNLSVPGLSVLALGLGEANAALLLIALLAFVLAMRQVGAMAWTQRLGTVYLAALPLLALYLVADATAARSLWLLPPLALGAIATSILAVR